MNIALWVAAGIVAAIYAAAGTMKLITSKAKLHERMGWVDDFSAGAIKAIAASEVLGAIGLILPPVTGIAVILAPLAATGLAIVSLGAVIVHARRREWQQVPITAVLLVLSVLVAWGRFGPYAF